MNCTDLNNLLDDYVADRLEGSLSEQISSHLSECEMCRKLVHQHKEYFVRINTFTAPSLSSSRSARILRLAVAEGQKKLDAKNQRMSFVRGFVAASVLAVTAFIGLNTLQPTSQPTALVGMYDWVEEISLVINVPEDMNGAQLILDLPADISIQGLEHLARVKWPVDLKKGSNVIELPVYIEPYAEYAEVVTLSASIVYKDKKRNFELDINLASPHNAMQGKFKLPAFFEHV